ncbi:MAG: Phosphatidylinositol 3-and 4-kinase [Verrucomicrobiaceae bacterium]|nr:Phosphatidylinositol 3-and 4-kinase [Verrucomicrobiaceae bacterium]
MPKDPDTVIPSSAFNMESNPHAVLGAQANESFMLKAKGNGQLGAGGETTAFAKYQYNVTKENLGALDIEYQAKMDVLGSTLQSSVDFPQAKKEYDDFKARAEAPYNVALASSALFADKDNMADDPTVGGDRGLLTRAVASKAVDKAMGMNSIAEEKFSTDTQGRPIGVSVQTDGQGFTNTYQGNDALLQVDLKDPNIQRGLSDLETMDYITGQIDRHAGNVFIEPTTGKVTGIDNDLAFPEVDRATMLAGSAPARQKAVIGMPHTMHAETAAKVLAMDPEVLRQTLKDMPVPNGVGKLSDASINGAVERLQDLQTELLKDAGSIEVVDAFDDNTYDQALAVQNSEVKKECKGEDIANLSPGQSTFASGTNKTSYLGAMSIQEKRIQLNMGVNQQGNPVPVYRPANAAGKAARAPGFPGPGELGHGAPQNMSAADKKQFFKETAKLAKMESKLAKLQASSAKLDNPGKLDKFKAFFKGGVNRAQGGIDKDIAKTGNAIDNQKQRLGTLADASKPKPGDFDTLKAAAKGPSASLSQSQSQSQSLGESQGLGTSRSRSNSDLSEGSSLGHSRSNAEALGLKRQESASTMDIGDKIAMFESKGPKPTIGSSSHLQPTNERVQSGNPGVKNIKQL